MGVLPPDFACMVADRMVVVVVVMHANWALCLVVVAINAAIERPCVAHAATPVLGMDGLGCTIPRWGRRWPGGRVWARGWGGGGVEGWGGVEGGDRGRCARQTVAQIDPPVPSCQLPAAAGSSGRSRQNVRRSSTRSGARRKV